MVAALREDDEFAALFCLISHLADNLYRLFCVSPVHPLAVYQVDELFHQRSVGLIDIHDDRTGFAVGEHDAERVIFPLMIGAHDIAAFVRQIVDAVALCRDVTGFDHSFDAQAVESIHLFLRIFFRVAGHVLHLWNHVYMVQVSDNHM